MGTGIVRHNLDADLIGDVAPETGGLLCFADGTRILTDQGEMLIEDLREGRPHASERLLPLVYDALRQLAQGKARGRHVGHRHVVFQKHDEDPPPRRIGKGGDLAYSDLEAICRMVSLWLRSGGRPSPRARFQLDSSVFTY